jgi:hypothetical protein
VEDHEPGPLEQEIINLLNTPAQTTLGSLFYAAGDREWWEALTPEDRGQVILASFAGLHNAARRIAREIDEIRWPIPPDDGEN